MHWDSSDYERLELPPRDPNVVDVSAGHYAVGEAPMVLVAPALGSCVGVALYDPQAQRGAMAHVMLPRPVDAEAGGLMERFAEHAVPRLVNALREQGSLQSRLVAKLAGGAAMFRADSILATIGERNVAEVKRQLTLLRVPVLAEDTGGSHARTVELHLETGVLLVRSYLHGVREL
ncbi:MAG: chemotaxis protein CheD [Coriobacteriaceae bacterium]|nr:chemotaxis protein CheD [Coriobacteriaceae bacterium]